MYPYYYLIETKHEDIVNAFKQFTTRDDISIILITQTVNINKTHIAHANNHHHHITTTIIIYFA